MLCLEKSELQLQTVKQDLLFQKKKSEYVNLQRTLQKSMKDCQSIEVQSMELSSIFGRALQNMKDQSAKQSKLFKEVESMKNGQLELCEEVS